MRLNSNINSFFKFKFGRDPKSWSLVELQDLLIRTKKRANDRYIISRSILDRIKSEVEPYKSTLHESLYMVYFYQEINGDNILRNYRITFDNYKKSFSWSIDNASLNERGKRLNFILGNTIKIGQEYHTARKLEDGAWKSHCKVNKVFSDKIEEKLKTIINKKNYGEEVVIIKVGDIKYFVKIEYSPYGYNKYHLFNEVSDKLIIL